MNSKKLIKITLIAVFFVMINTLRVQAASIFDNEYYAYSNPDVVAAKGEDEAALNSHFEEWGVKEGRNPSIVFNAKYYLAHNGDVAAAYGKNAYEAAYNHFIKWGMKEGRRASAVFDVKTYLNINTDVKAAYGNNYEAAIQHFLAWGMKEGRAASDTFDLQHYLANNADVKVAFSANYKKAYYHYATYGVNESHRKVKGTDHVYGEVKTTKATCDKEGKKVQTCVACGATKTLSTTKKLGHKYQVVEGEGQFTYTLNKDDTVTAKLNLVCANDKKHTSTVDATVEMGEKEVATCQEAGKIECTAKATYDGKEYTGEKTFTVAKKDHEYTKQVAITATCKKSGTYYNACKYCGKEEMKKDASGNETNSVDVKTGKLDHDYSKFTETVVADCTHGGYDLYTCSICGEATNTINMTEAEPHDFDYEEAKTEAKEATCTEAGNPEYYTCKNCHNNYSDNKGTTKLEADDIVIEAKTHDYTAKVTKAATCTTTGVKTYTCKNCGDKYTETIPATAHANKTTVAAKAATCGAKGNVSYDKCPDCNKYLANADTVTALGGGLSANDEITLAQTETAATGSHTYGNWITTQEADATHCQERYQKCTVCGHRNIDTTGHTPTAGKQVAATCTTDGSELCSKCHTRYYPANLKATGHSWNSGAVTTAATCTTAGVKTYECNNCDETKTEEVPALGHNLTSHAAQAADCVNPGNSEYTSCSGCNKCFVEDENGTVLTKNDGTTTDEKYKEVALKDVTIPAIGHKWDAGVVSAIDNNDKTTGTDEEKALAAKSCQKRTYTCTNKGCNATRKEFIAHSLKEVAEKDPTCTEKGNIKYYTCNDANEFYKLADDNTATPVTIDGVDYEKIAKADTEKQATGHTFTSATILDDVTVAASPATITGKRVSFRCDVCKESTVKTVNITYVAATATEAAHYEVAVPADVTTVTGSTTTFYFAISGTTLVATTEADLAI